MLLELTSSSYDGMSDPLWPSHGVDPGGRLVEPEVLAGVLAVLVLHMDAVGDGFYDGSRDGVRDLPLIHHLQLHAWFELTL